MPRAARRSSTAGGSGHPGGGLLDVKYAGRPAAVIALPVVVKLMLSSVSLM